MNIQNGCSISPGGVIFNPAIPSIQIPETIDIEVKSEDDIQKLTKSIQKLNIRLNRGVTDESTVRIFNAAANICGDSIIELKIWNVDCRAFGTEECHFTNCKRLALGNIIGSNTMHIPPMRFAKLEEVKFQRQMIFAKTEISSIYFRTLLNWTSKESISTLYLMF